MNFNQKEYLSEAEKRVKHLQEIVGGRPVAILVPGPSIYELECRIEELCDVDICYFGLNSYTVIETNILQKIGKQFSAIMCSSREGIPGVLDDIIDFLNRDEDNMFISSFWRGTFELIPRYFDLQYFCNKYNKKLIFFNLTFERIFPNMDNPLTFMISTSLLVLIQMAIIGKASGIILFGADGGFSKDLAEWFYRQDDIGHRGFFDDRLRWTVKDNLIRDTNKWFNTIATTTISNLYKTYGFAPIAILNCSEDSLYTPFPKVSYDTAFKHILERT